MPVRVLHFSTHHEACGIGKYQEMFLEALEGVEDVQNDFFEISPNHFQDIKPDAYHEVIDPLREKLKDYDVLHIQHEFSFFPGATFALACKTAKDVNKKLIVTIHTSVASVPYPYTVRNGSSLRKTLGYAKRRVQAIFEYRAFIRDFADSLRSADLVIVHNTKTRMDLVRLGVPEAKFAKFSIPVPVVDRSVEIDTIGERLRANPGDVIVAIVGFINRLKGTSEAVEALALLPDRYKLAIIGGLHARGGDPYGGPKYYEELMSLIDSLGLKERVYITGYVDDDARLNALVRECDVCVYPYDKAAYDNASSAALNNAFANHVPVVTFPTGPFKEINDVEKYLTLAEDFTPEALAKAIQSVDLPKAREMSRRYSETFAYPVVGRRLAELYMSLVNKKSTFGS